MVWEVAALGISAALAGVLVRGAAGAAAKAAGRSRREAEEAVGTAGISLVAERDHDHNHDQQENHGPLVGAR
jgi:hypothetical protein